MWKSGACLKEVELQQRPEISKHRKQPQSKKRKTSVCMETWAWRKALSHKAVNATKKNQEKQKPREWKALKTRSKRTEIRCQSLFKKKHKNSIKP